MIRQPGMRWAEVAPSAGPTAAVEGVTLAQGEAVYSTGDPPRSGLGLKWSGKELDAALDGPVGAVLFDDEGKARIEEILSGIVETAFEQDGLCRVLADPGDIKDRRVGQAIPETWLTDHRDCLYPRPGGREERKRGSSRPGADLVGRLEGIGEVAVAARQEEL